MNDAAIEVAIREKGLTAPRIKPDDIENNIDKVFYFTAGDGVFGREVAASGTPVTNEPSLNTLTFCVLVLKNGFTVTGESACASPENFDRGIGECIARQNAVQKIWPLMGYELRGSLHRRAVFEAAQKTGNGPA